MSLLNILLGGQNGGLVNALAKNVNLNESDIKNILGQVLPALSKGVKNNVSTQDGLGSLLNALNSGNHQRFLEDPEQLNNQSTVTEGNAILGHIFGSKDVSRNVAAHAAQKTGVDSSIIKKMLPLVASIAMGALSQKSSGSGLLGSALASGGGSGAMDMISGLLDADNDGDITDDLLNLARKFF